MGKIKILTRSISVVVLICFGLSNIAFASEMNSFKLAPESKFSRFQGTEFKDVAEIQIAIREALKSAGSFDIGSIEALGERQFAENSVFTSRIAGT
ncbi:MAG: hypothetical protein WC419_05035, partial [Candidatus Omnitrophota bacterium]